MAKAKIKIDWKALGVALVAGVAIVFSASALVKVTRSETTETIGWGEYQIAGVSEDGKIDKEDNSSITTSLINADGLKVDVDEDANVQYIVHYYKANKDYISSSAVQTADYTAVLPTDAKYARVELTPIADEDGEVTIFELPGYASLIEITVNK